MSKQKGSSWDGILRVVIVVLGILIVLVLAAIIIAAFNKKSQDIGVSSKPQSIESIKQGKVGYGIINVEIAPDAKVVESSLTGSVLVIRTNGPSGEQVILFDIKKGVEIGRVRLIEK